MWNRTSDLWIPRCNALPLSHRDSVVSEVYYEIEVHMTRVLHTARINYVDSVMSSRGIGIFFLSHARDKTKKNFFISLPGSKLTIFPILFVTQTCISTFQ